jgi:hypothetical protein
MNSLTNVKVGDPVMVSSVNYASYQAEVTSAGPKWITAGRGRYRRDDGFSPTEPGSARIETLNAYALRIEREKLVSKMASHGWVPKRLLSLDQLRAAARLLDAFEQTAKVADRPALSEGAFGRTGCHLIEGESPVASRRRGALVEVLQDAAEALRTGHREVSFMLDLARRNLADWKAAQ